MGYVFNFRDARDYDQWVEDSRNRFEVDQENQLLLDMLRPLRGESVLEIGCGTGSTLVTLVERGLRVTGIDPSPYMLDTAIKQVGDRAELYRGFGEELPGDDNSFNHACFMTTLEFVEDPAKAVEEACRVAKDRVFIGVLNRFAIRGIHLRVAGIFNQSIFNRAKFFGIWELKRMVHSIAGPVPLSWRTVNQLPAVCGSFTQNLEDIKFVQRCPFGAFVGMVFSLVPRFRTRPLALRYRRKQTTGAVPG
jgi:SAM-dependent methyltransferase